MLDSTPKPIEGPEIEAILGQGVIIPPQPKALMEIEHLAKQPRVNVKAIANVIATDPGLLASVFKVVNSPAMGLSRRIDSAETAITLLGLTQIANLVKSIAIRQALSGNSLAYEKFWERSGDIAQIATAIARKQFSICHIPADQAYMAGLFHDCGVPILMQRFADYCKELGQLNGGGWPDLAQQDRQHDTDHCVVGYMVGKHWRLPDLILQGIRHHHETPTLDHPAKTVVAMLQAATHIYNVMMKTPDDAEWAICRQHAIEELGVSTDGLREFEEDIIENYSAAR